MAIKTNIGYITDGVPAIWALSPVSGDTWLNVSQEIITFILKNLGNRIPNWRVRYYTHGYGVDGLFIKINPDAPKRYVKKIRRHVRRYFEHVPGVDPRCLLIHKQSKED